MTHLIPDPCPLIPDRAEILGPGEGVIRLVGRAHPFKLGAVDLEIPEGTSLAEAFEILQPDPYLRKFGEILLTRPGVRDAEHIDRMYWHCTRPRAGTQINIVPLPRGGEGKNPLATVLSIMVIAAALILPGAQPGLFAAGTLGGGFLAVGSIAALAAINYFLAPALPKLPELSDDARRRSAFLTGAQNRFDLNGVVARVLGTHRTAPAYYARPYTEVVGDDQYLRLPLSGGLGPVRWHNETWKIGDTLLSNFEDVELQTDEGWPPDPRTFLPAAVDTTGNKITVPEHGYLDEQILEVFTDGTMIGGLPAAPQSFATTDVDPVNNTIAIAAHGLVDGQPLRFETTDVLPGGLALKKRYFVVGAAAGTFQVSTKAGGVPLGLEDVGGGVHSVFVGHYCIGALVDSFQLALTRNGTAIGFTTQGTGTHTVQRQVDTLGLFSQSVLEQALTLALDDEFTVLTTEPRADEISIDWTFPQGLANLTNEGKREDVTVVIEANYAPSPGVPETFTVNPTTDVFTSVGHTFVNGQIADVTSAGVLPLPLVAKRDYYFRDVSGDTYKLAETPTGAAIDIEDAGTGVHTITQHDWSIGALGVSYAAQTVDLPAKPARVVHPQRPADGGPWTATTARFDVVRIDRYSGEILVDSGRTVETGVVVGTPSEVVEFYEPALPSLFGGPFFPALDPVDAPVRIAHVLRTSEEGTGVSAPEIEDVRPADAPFGVPATDFDPSPSGPEASSIDLAAGQLLNAGFTTTSRVPGVPIRRTLRFIPPQRGLYDVRLRRTTPESTASSVIDGVTWTALRTIRYENPVNMEGVATAALRIRRTDQLEGVLPPFTVVLSGIIKVFDGTDWLPGESSNPADLYRHILQGRENKKALEGARLDLAAIEAWKPINEGEGFTFNAIIDYPISAEDLLREVLAAGRAVPDLPDGTWGLAIDEPQAAPANHYGPHNSWGFSADIGYLDTLHAVRIRFVNRDKDYDQDELLVFADGFDAATAQNIEGLELPGIVDPELIWRHGRKFLAEAATRRQGFSWFTDFEGLLVGLGKTTLLAHDAIKVGLGSGRVKAIQVSGPNTTGVTLEFEVTMEVAKTYAARFRLADNTSLVVTVNTVPGATTTLVFTTPVPTATGPAIGDSAFFGETGLDTIELQIRNIEGIQDLGLRLTGVPAPAEIYRADVLAETFAPGDVNTGTERIAIADHEFIEGELASVTSDTALPGGLVANPQTFGPADVDIDTDRIAITGHGLVDGQVGMVTSTGVMPGGLIAGRKVWVVGATANDLQLALTKGGAPIDLTLIGTQTHKITALYRFLDVVADVDFQLAATKPGTAVNLTSGGTGVHTIARASPPFESKTTQPGALALPTPVIETVVSDETVLLRDVDGSLVSRILVKLATPPGLDLEIANTTAQWRVAGTSGTWQRLWLRGAASEVFLSPVDDRETYDFRLRYLSAGAIAGRTAAFSYQEHSGWTAFATETVIGKTSPPGDVEVFWAQQNGAFVTFRWESVADLDVRGYVIAYGPAGVLWENALQVTAKNQGIEITTGVVPPGTWDLLIKAEDTSGNESLNAKRIGGFVMTSIQNGLLRTPQEPGWTAATAPATALDAGAGGHDMALTAGAVFGPPMGPGRFSGRFPVNGATGTVTHHADFNLSEFTMAFGITFRRVDITGNFLVTKGSIPNNMYGILLGGGSEGFNLSYSHGNGLGAGSVAALIAGPGISITGQRFVVAITRISGNLFTVYVAGQQAAQSIITSAITSNTSDLVVNASSDRAFDLDNLAFWDRALTVEEINEKAGQRLVPADETALVAYWPFDEGTRAGFVYHPRFHALVPQSIHTADDPGDGAANGFDLFDNLPGVWDQVAAAVHEAPELDVGFDDRVTTYAEIDPEKFGPVTAGQPQGLPLLELDHRLAAGSYDGFEAWSLGEIEARYIKQRVVVRRPMYLKGFSPVVDAFDKDFDGNVTVTVAAAGVAVTFPEPFHNTPVVEVSAEGVAGAARYATYESVTTTGFTLFIFDSAGVKQTGNGSWHAAGD